MEFQRVITTVVLALVLGAGAPLVAALELENGGLNVGDGEADHDPDDAAAADEPIDAEARIQRIRDQSHQLASLARERLPDSLYGAPRERADAYRKWLEQASRRLAVFADRWEQARVRERSTDSATTEPGGQLMGATRQMQEMNQSFNLQYLDLQQNMQQENRQFTMMSNVMKLKHDTAKAAINNVR